MNLAWGIVIGVILSCSLAIITIAELVKDWLHTLSLTLSSSEYQALLKALHYPTSTLRIGEGSAFCSLIAFLNFSLVIVSIAGGLSVVLGFAFIGKASWTPLSAISRLSSPIPHAESGSSQILALNIVVVVDVCISTIIYSIFSGALWWGLSSRQSPEGPQSVIPQRANPRNSQAAAPAEYDLENLISSETAASLNIAAAKTEGSANLTSSEIGDNAKLSSPKTASSVNLTSQDGAG